MFIIDNILMSPARGLLAIFREIHNAAIQEVLDDGATIRAELAELYLLLETGRISTAEFDNQEGVLLDRLDALDDRESSRDEELSWST